MSRSLVTAAPKASHFSKPLVFGIIGGLAATAGVLAYADITPLELTQSIDHTLLSVYNLFVILCSQAQHFVIFNKYVKKQLNIISGLSVFHQCIYDIIYIPQIVLLKKQNII